MRPLFHCILLSLLILAAPARADGPALTVGIYDNPPQVFKGKDGGFRGIYVDLIKEIARLEGWRLTIVWGTWAQHLDNLKKDRLDLITTIAYDVERDRYIDYSREPVVTVWGQIYQKPGLVLRNMLDLGGKRIAVMRNGLFGIRLRQLCDKFQIDCDILPLAGYRDAMRAVSEGRADAAAVASLFGYAFEHEFRIVRSAIIYEPFGLRFAAPEGRHAGILTTIDNHLKTWKADNGSFYFQTLFRYTGGAPSGKWTPPDWLIWLLGTGAGLLLISLAWTIILRRQRIELARFRDTLDRTGDCVFMFQPGDFRFIYVNNGAVEQVGYDREELLTMTPLDIKPEFTPPRFHALVKPLLTHPGRPRVFETVHRHKNGFDIPVEIVLQYVAPKSGQPRFVAIVRDITERRRTEMRLKQLTVAVEQSPVSVIITDPVGNIQYVNPRFSEISGYGFNEAIGQNPRILKSGEMPEEKYAELWRTITNGGTWKGEFHNRKKDGSLHWESASISPIFDAKGGITHFLAIKEDITQRKEIEQELHREQQNLRNILLAMNDGVYIVNKDYDIEFVNHVIMKAFGPVGGRKCFAYFHDRFEPCDWCKNAEVFTGKSISWEWHSAKNGRTYELFDTPLRNHDGSLSKLEFFHDITQRKQLENDLRQAKEAAEVANKSKSEFLATMSHETRTPLNAILGMGEILKETELSETQSWCVKTLNRSGGTLLTLINDILDLSKIEAGQLTLERTPFDLHAATKGIIDLFVISALDKEITLTREIGEEVPQWVQGDQTRLRQVLLNLIGNAVKFTREGRIGVKVEMNSDVEVAFSVTDTGPGIAEEKLTEIFQPFTQADASTTRKHGGTGLGLTICRRLVDLMGGTIRVISKVGHGSTFLFTVPLPETSRKDPDDAREDGPPPLRRERTGTGDDEMNILLVEDAEENQMVIQGFLRKENCRIHIAENGAEAVERFMNEPFDIVLMDIQMPVMDGCEATRRIRSWEKKNGLQPTPIIALTAHAMADESAQFLAAGCNQHVSKPVRKKRLLGILRQYHRPTGAPPPGPAAVER